MDNKYFMKDPSVISFSGGRTSGFMLAKVLEAHGGGFQNMLKLFFVTQGLSIQRL